MRELARRAGLSHPYISNVQSGKQEPGAKFYQGVARAFGVTPESLERLDSNGVTPESRQSDPTYLTLMELAQKLTDEDLADVLDYAIYRFKRSQNLPL